MFEFNMENMNLIEFCSPNGFTNIISPQRIPLSNSPGHNPFDTLFNLAENCPNNMRDTIEEFSIQYNKPPGDFDNVFNCYSEACVSISDDLPRESLGILKIEVLNSSLEDAYSNIASNGTYSFNQNKTDTLELNTAFLCPYSNCDIKTSYLSSSSSSLTPLEFNSGSLEASEPSKIYSINSLHYSKNDLLSKTENILNDAFITSIRTSLYPNEHDARYRISSLPEMSTARKQIDHILNKSEDCLDSKLSVSIEMDKPADQDNIDGEFNDSVFIEANHFAEKLADGSIHSIQCFEENLLDCISPPTFEDYIQSAEEPKVKDIFKCIDQLMPTVESQSTAISSSDSHIFKGNNSRDFVVKEQNSLVLKEGLSGIFNRKSSSSNSSTSRDTNSLLQNLSEIINNENRSLEQNIEGQKLLFGLADILCSNTSRRPIDSLDDSGHSSIEHEDPQIESDHNSFEAALDLRVTSKSNNDQVLDLSVKSKYENHSLSLCDEKTRTTLINNVKLQNPLASSVSNLDQCKFNNAATIKLKTKRVEENTMKKGPLKAVIPIGNMLKYQSYGGKKSTHTVTPPKQGNVQSSLFKVKRTSTPIMEPKLTPVAQSTPDAPNSEPKKTKSSQTTSKIINKPKTYSPISSYNSKKDNATQSLSTNIQFNRSISVGSHQSAVESGTLTRRHSESELKSNKPSIILKRSYSIGKTSKVATVATERMKRSVLPTKDLKNSSETQKSGILQPKNRGIISNIKPFNLLSKMKKNKMDKENVTS